MDEEETPAAADADAEEGANFEDTSETNPELDDAIFGGGLQAGNIDDSEGEQIKPEDIKL